MQPVDDSDITVRPISFTTSDGVSIRGDLATVPTPRAAAIVCHPHPQYGGDRHNPVVETLFTALPTIGIAALRFDFRPEYGGGSGEVLDARAALDTLDRETPEVPLVATGYSFGALICLGLDDERVGQRVLVAPPLTMAADIVSLPDHDHGVATLVLAPAHDQFCPPDAAAPIVESWPDTDLDVLPTADHFLFGAGEAMRDRSLAWLDSRLGA